MLSHHVRIIVDIAVALSWTAATIALWRCDHEPRSDDEAQQDGNDEADPDDVRLLAA